MKEGLTITVATRGGVLDAKDGKSGCRNPLHLTGDFLLARCCSGENVRTRDHVEVESTRNLRSVVRQTDLEMEREPRDAAAGEGDLDDVRHRYRSHSGR